MKEKIERIFIWGTGYIANQVMEQGNIFEQYNIIGFIDNDKEKQGNSFWGKLIYEPYILLKEQYDKIIILTNKYEEIFQQIMGIIRSDKKILIENEKYFYKQSILKRYEGVEDSEIKAVLSYIKKNDLQVFNYDFINKYKDLKMEIRYDTNCGMYYVYHYGKKLYFAKSFNTELKVERYYKSLLLEQDEESPHRYLTSQFNVNEGDVVLDIGVAEGNFSLEVVEKASKIYMFEMDEEWIEALRETFKDYKEKVVIVPQFITSTNEGKYATLDSLIEEPVNFIKMDIEGNEWDALLGAEKVFRNSKNIKCAICSYHADFDEILIIDILRKYGLNYTVTPGYMWFPELGRKGYVSSKLCRGIVQGMGR